MVVTAERREASIQDTSISITAFTGEMLDDFGIRNQEDLQNFIPATTIQPYDATIRGVGRNFRALGGDPGVSTYMNGIYSEDLLTATAATFWDVERIEILRGPQGTLYGRNAVGGAMNILYKDPTDEFDFAVKGIAGNFDTQEYYGMVNVPLIDGLLNSRFNFAHRDRDGVIEEIGTSDDLDGLGTDNWAADAVHADRHIRRQRALQRHAHQTQFRWRQRWRSGDSERRRQQLSQHHRYRAGLSGHRYRPIPIRPTYAQNNWYDTTQPILNFTIPSPARRYRPSTIVWVPMSRNSTVFETLPRSLDGFGVTSQESADRYNECVFDGDIDGSDVCAATNGLNQEKFDQQGLQFNIEWDATDWLQLKYLYGHNDLTYQRTTDDDNTASQFADRQFYVNHEATYRLMNSRRSTTSPKPCLSHPGFSSTMRRSISAATSIHSWVKIASSIRTTM